MADSDVAQRYDVREALDRIYRLLRGDILSNDAPDSLSGTRRSTNEIASRLAELMQNSLPGETFTLPLGHNYRFGQGDNYLNISSSGTLSLHGNATVWDDLRFSAVSSKLGGSKDPGFAVFKTNASGSQGVFTYWFDDDAEEEIYLIAQMPHAWKAGSLISPHVHWTPAANGTGTVSWGLEYSWANVNSVFPSTSTIYGNQVLGSHVNISGSVHYLTELSAITGTSKTLSSMIVMRLFRNATGAGSSGDSYANDAGLLEFDIHYEMDGLGSESEYTK